MGRTAMKVPGAHADRGDCLVHMAGFEHGKANTGRPALKLVQNPELSRLRQRYHRMWI